MCIRDRMRCSWVFRRVSCRLRSRKLIWEGFHKWTIWWLERLNRFLDRIEPEFGMNDFNNGPYYNFKSNQFYLKNIVTINNVEYGLKCSRICKFIVLQEHVTVFRKVFWTEWHRWVSRVSTCCQSHEQHNQSCTLLRKGWKIGKKAIRGWKSLSLAGTIEFTKCDFRGSFAWCWW